MGEGSSVMWSKRFERERGGGEREGEREGGGSFDLERKQSEPSFWSFDWFYEHTANAHATLFDFEHVNFDSVFWF